VSPLVHTEDVMGTVVSFTVHPESMPEPEVRAAVGDACRLLHHLDDTFSIWKPESPMSRLRRGELGLADVPPEIPLVLELCADARDLSNGWFDPWAMPGGVDPTGLVKGWAVEQASEVLRRAGVAAALVNGGGDLVALGRPPLTGSWRIGIRHPWDAAALACVVDLDRAIATSGSYERGAHLVDPRTGQPSVAAASATVTGPSLAVADALATALAAGGDEVLALLGDLAGYDGYLIRADATEEATATMAFAD
jgi:thiamine biosynthesis lipoprotein